ncbi:unnamed protein product [Caenorhabditis brenneri]
MVVGQRNPVYKIRSCDGQILVVQDWVIAQSKCLSIVFAYQNVPAPPLQTSVCSLVLKKVIEWCSQHRHDNADQVYRNIPNWDAQFLQDNKGILLHLIEAAFRLEIRGLLSIACKAVSIMSGRSVRDVKLRLRVGGLGDEDDDFEDDDILEQDEEEEDGDDAERLPPIPAA